MTDDEKATAVQEGLAGLVRCESCGLKMSLVAVWLDGGRRSPRLCYDCWAIAFCTEVYGVEDTGRRKP